MKDLDENFQECEQIFLSQSGAYYTQNNFLPFCIGVRLWFFHLSFENWIMSKAFTSLKLDKLILSKRYLFRYLQPRLNGITFLPAISVILWKHSDHNSRGINWGVFVSTRTSIGLIMIHNVHLPFCKETVRLFFDENPNNFLSWRNGLHLLRCADSSLVTYSLENSCFLKVK